MRATVARRLSSLAPVLAHLAVVAWTFSGPLFSGRVLYFRDIAYFYFPNAVFLERSLAQGVWPLWNPTSDAGAPFLVTSPVELLLVGLLGAEGALRFGPPLFQLLAMTGATRLGANLGLAPWGAWLAGLAYGLSGYYLSTVNLLQLNHAAAWAPWVIAALLGAWARPGPRRAAAFGLLLALQVTTFGAETLLLTALVGVVLLPGPPTRTRLAAVGAGAFVAVLLSLPSLLGALDVVRSSARAAGFARDVAFAFSLHPAALLDTLVPRAFGDVHTFSDAGYWGQAFFPDGFPYLLSLYLGPALVWLALRAGPGHGTRRLAALALLGVLLALGSHGPFAWLLEPAVRYLRAPVKLLFLTALALSLLAGRGLDRARRETLASSPLALVAASLLLAAAALLRLRPDLLPPLLGAVAPPSTVARAVPVIAATWPADLGTAALFLLGAALACRARALAPLAGVLVGLDLLLANGSVNLATSPGFYALRPQVTALLKDARVDASSRVFAYGASAIPDLHFAPEVARRNRDVPLYAVERQALVPRSHVLDGLEAAYDEDRTGSAPRGSTLSAHERVPALFRQHHARLRLAAVRHVVSFRPLPEDLALPRGEARLEEVLEPLRLYELKDPLPRAIVVGRYEVESDAPRRAARLEDPTFDPRATALLDAPPPAAVASAAAAFVPGAAARFERLSPHRVRLRVDGGPGIVVVSEGYHPGWRAEGPEGPRPLVPANGRYWAIPSHGGGETITVRYEPGWRAPALAGLALGLVAAAGLALAGRARRADEAGAA